MPMQNPCHPGELILHDWIGGLELTVEAAAKHMQVPAQSLEDICQGNAPVTTEMAVRLSKALGSTPRFWIQLQANYDAAQAEHMLDQIDIKRIERAA